MKVGDTVMSIKTRPYENAKVIKADISIRDCGSVRTKYVAEYKDGSTLIFYGWDINKNVFKVAEADGQICLADYFGIEMEVEDDGQKKAKRMDEGTERRSQILQRKKLQDIL